MMTSALTGDDQDDAEPVARPEPMSQLQIKLPSTVEDDSADESNDEDDDQRPFTNQELRIDLL